MPRSLTVLLLTMSLAACATARSDAPPPIVEAARAPLKVYSPAFRERAAREIQGLPDGSATAEMIIDYGQLRRAVCAAEGWRQDACLAIRAARRG